MILLSGQRVQARHGYSTALPGVDFETFSEAGYVWRDDLFKYVSSSGSKTSSGLGVCGVGVYAAHPSTDVVTLSYDLKDGRGVRRWDPNLPPPEDLIEHIRQGRPIQAWNSLFEYLIWNEVCHRRMGWPVMRLNQMHDAMAKARASSMPGKLAVASKVVGVEVKDTAKGNRVIKRYCLPRNPTKTDFRVRILPNDDGEKGQEIYEYCDQDVVAEGATALAFPDLSEYEREVWLFDQRVNIRGCHVDMVLVAACRKIIAAANTRYEAELPALTDSAVMRASEVANTIRWLASRSIHVDSLDEESVTATLKRIGDTDPAAKRVLEIRAMLASAGAKKVESLYQQTAADGQCRGMFMYHAAHTGRWASMGVQLHNMVSSGPSLYKCESCQAHYYSAIGLDSCPSCGAADMWNSQREWDSESMHACIEVLNSGDLDLAELYFGDKVVHVIASCVRGMLTARPGYELLGSDYSAIEAVVLAVLAGEEWRIEVFRTHGKIYEMCAAKITGISFESMMEYKKTNGSHHPHRKPFGKVPELACFGPDTQVLTARGYVAIPDVKITDTLWDGIEWVSHEGVVAKGRRPVLVLDGVHVTPDHPVSLNGSWTLAKHLASSPSTLRSALVSGSENLPWSSPPPSDQERGHSSRAPAEWGHTLSPETTCVAGSPPGAPNAAVLKRRAHTLSCTASTPTSCRTWNIVVGWLTGCVRQLRDATAPRLGGTQTMAGAGSLSVTSGGRTPGSFWLTCSRWKGGTYLLWNWIESIMTPDTAPAISGSLPAALTGRTSAASPPLNGLSERCAPVYDIVNAGPRHRFTIRTNTGHLLVHNSGYQGWIGAWLNFGADEFMTEDEIKKNILKWRDESPAIVELWGGQHRRHPDKWEFTPELHGLEGAFVASILNPGQPMRYRFITYTFDGTHVYCTLPSGRIITYNNARLEEQVKPRHKMTDYRILYHCYNTNPKKGPMGWTEVSTYGGSLTENCIAEGTSVLTSRGWVSIEAVRPDDEIHDGVELVSHGGLLFKSYQACVTVDGVYMTPDHEVLTDEGWQFASQEPRPYRPSLWPSEGHAPGQERREKTAVGVPVRLREGVREDRRRCQQGGEARPDTQLRMFNQSLDRREDETAWHDPAPRVCCVAQHGGSLSVAFAPSVGQLWRTRNCGVRSMAGEVRELLVRYGAKISSWLAARSSGQQRRLLPGELPVGRCPSERQQQAEQRPDQHPLGSHDCCGGVSAERDRSDNIALPSSARVARGTVVHPPQLSQQRVYDILNCGPRNRFVVLGERGPFIVHNCTQAVARDIFAHGALVAESKGYEVVLHTHDELAAEVPTGTRSIDEFEQCMMTLPAWCADWPIRAAGGWRGVRYRKD